jgi:hypothetical protein
VIGQPVPGVAHSLGGSVLEETAQGLGDGTEASGHTAIRSEMPMSGRAHHLGARITTVVPLVVWRQSSDRKLSGAGNGSSNDVGFAPTAEALPKSSATTTMPDALTSPMRTRCSTPSASRRL